MIQRIVSHLTLTVTRTLSLSLTLTQLLLSSTPQFAIINLQVVFFQIHASMSVDFFNFSSKVQFSLLLCRLLIYSETSSIDGFTVQAPFILKKILLIKIK